MADHWPKYNAQTMEYMNLTIESDYQKGAKRVGHGPRRKQCVFWKSLVPNILSASGCLSSIFITCLLLFKLMSESLISDGNNKWTNGKKTILRTGR